MKWNLILKLVVLSVATITFSSCDTTISDITDLTGGERITQSVKSNYLGAKVELEFYDKEVKCSIHKNNDRVESAFFTYERYDSVEYADIYIYRDGSRYSRLILKKIFGFVYSGKIEYYDDGVKYGIITFD